MSYLILILSLLFFLSVSLCFSCPSREWNGELRFLQNIKMRRVKEADKVEKQSNKQSEMEMTQEADSSWL